MSDNPRNTGEPDRSHVSLEQDHEVRYWTERFAVSEETLRTAVVAVGPSAATVAAWLQLNR